MTRGKLERALLLTNKYKQADMADVQEPVAIQEPVDVPMDVEETPEMAASSKKKKSRSKSAVATLAMMEPKPFKKAVANVDSAVLLVRYRDSDKFDDAQKEVLSARIMQLSKHLIFEGNVKEFERRVGCCSSFSKLNKLRFTVNGNPIDDAETRRKKVNIIEKRMRVLSAAENATKRVRKPGTGTKVEEEAVYADNKANREAGRVGQTYKKVSYTDAEYEERPLKMRRIRRVKPEGEEKPKRTNLWIEAIKQAKTELNAPKFVIIRSEVKDPNDEAQVLGNKVYQRAREILVAQKAEAAQ